VPIEAYLALQLASNQALNCACAEARARGRFNWRAALLSPAQDEPPIRFAQPLNLNLTIGHGQSPVLDRIGRQFVHGYRNCLCGHRLE
jgi:hypothetical protein